MRAVGFMALCAILALTAAGARNPSGEAKALLGATRAQISARGDIKRALREAQLGSFGPSGARL